MEIKRLPHVWAVRPTRKAIDYAYKLRLRLRRYALDGRYHIDNNAVERGQRPSVMGRKNYLFSKNDRGGLDNAVFYSLLDSCNIIGVKLLEWLTLTPGRFRPDSTEDEITALLCSTTTKNLRSNP